MAFAAPITGPLEIRGESGGSIYIRNNAGTAQYKNSGGEWTNLGTGGGVESETDPVVSAVDGLVKASGGVISAAVAADILAGLGTDPVSVTVNIATGTALPETATPGEMFIKADGPAGGKFYYSPSTDTWEQITSLGGTRKIIPTAVDYNITSAEISDNKNILVMASAELDVSIPIDQCDDATGVEIEVKKTTGDKVSLYSNDASDQFVTSSDTELTAGNELDLAAADGSSVRLCCAAAHKWYVIDQNGTATDGGARDGDCMIDDSYEPTEDISSLGVAGYASTRVYVGTVITPDVSKNSCTIAFQADGISDTACPGDCFDDLDFFIEVWSLTGTPAVNLGTKLAYSAEIDGADIAEDMWLLGTFSTETISGPVAVTIKAVDNDEGANGTPVWNGSSPMLSIKYTGGTDIGDMAGGKIATDGKHYWNASGTRTAYVAEDDIAIRFYGVNTP